MRADVEAVVREVSGWEGINASPHRFGGVEFTLGKVEVGHIHGNGMVDIPFTRALREALVADGEAEHHHVLPDSGWISFYLNHTGEVADAIRLFKLSYLQKTRRRGSTSPQEGFEAALAALGFGARVNTLFVPQEAEDEG
jgi:hypothetical protein